MFDNSEQVYNKLNTIFHAIIAIPMLVYGIVYLQADKSGLEPFLKIPDSNISVGVFFVLIALNVWFLFSRKKSNRIKLHEIIESNNSLKAKMEDYYHQSVNNYVILSIPTLGALIGYIVTYYHGFTVIYLMVLFTMSFFRPSTHHICEDLKLNVAEKEIVLNKKPFPVEEGSTN